MEWQEQEQTLVNDCAAILFFLRASLTLSSLSANIRWKKVYLRQPVGKSQLRKTNALKLLPLHAVLRSLRD